MFDATHDGRWSGGDGAHSALLPDGRDVILFGDTFGGSVSATGERNPNPPFFPNSMAIVSGKQLSWVNEPGRPAIPPAPDGAVHWPEAIVTTGSGVHVFTNRVRRIGTAVSGIQVVGQSLVTFDLNTLRLRSVTTLSTLPSDHGDTGVWWSAGAAIDDGYVYVYGVHLDQPGDYGRSLYVARAPLGSLAETCGWRYWNGETWTPDSRLSPDARLLAKQVDAVVSVWRAGTTWHLVSQKYGMLGRDVGLWTAPAPQGPWRDEKLLYRIPPCRHSDAMFYESTAHPEVALASGKLLLSYSRNGSNRRIYADADWYKPQYVEVSV
jgi:hypothetical protein